MASLGPLEPAIPVRVRAPQFKGFGPTALRTYVRVKGWAKVYGGGSSQGDRRIELLGGSPEKARLLPDRKQSPNPEEVRADLGYLI